MEGCRGREVPPSSSSDGFGRGFLAAGARAAAGLLCGAGTSPSAQITAHVSARLLSSTRQHTSAVHVSTRVRQQYTSVHISTRTPHNRVNKMGGNAPLHTIAHKKGGEGREERMQTYTKP